MAKKNTTNDAAATKVVPKKQVPVKKSTTKKTAVKKTAVKKATVKKTSTTKTAPKKVAAKKSTTKKVAAKKSAPKKAAAKKPATKTRRTTKKKPTVKQQVKSANERVSDLNVNELLKALKSEHAMDRIAASKRIHIMIEEDPARFKAHIAKLVAALEVFEAQTRWELLDCLCLLSAIDAVACAKAVEAAQRSMFEEANVILTLTAFKFLCTLGATNIANSKLVWPYIMDAIETFDGDIDYDKFLQHAAIFAGGKISAPVKKELIEIIKFDAKNSSGAIGYRANIVLATLKGKKIPKQKPSKKTLAAIAAKKKEAEKQAAAEKKAAQKKAVAAKKKAAAPKKKAATTKKAAVKKTATTKKAAVKKTAEKKKAAVKKTAEKKKTAVPKKKAATTKKVTPKKKAAAKKSAAKKKKTATKKKSSTKKKK